MQEAKSVRRMPKISRGNDAESGLLTVADARTPPDPGGDSRRSRVTVRFTRTEDDISARVALSRFVNADCPDGLPYDAATVRKSLERMMGQPNHCLLQAEIDGRVIGGLIGVVAPHPWSPALGASIKSYFVLPQHRGSLAAVKLLHGFRRWAKAQGAVRMYVGVTSRRDIERTDRFLKHLGFRFSGGNYRAVI